MPGATKMLTEDFVKALTAEHGTGPLSSRVRDGATLPDGVDTSDPQVLELISGLQQQAALSSSNPAPLGAQQN